MEQTKISLWTRFKSAVPINIRKIQLILGAAAGSFASISAISFPGKMAFIGEFAGYIAAACGGAAFLLQFAMNTQTIVETKEEVKVVATTTNTVTSTEVPVVDTTTPDATDK